MKKIGLVFSLLLFLSVSFQVSAQWFWQNPLPQGNELFGVDFINENLGWAVGKFGTIIKTTDGGTIWSFQQNTKKNTFIDISFYDQNYGLIVGSDGIVLTTSNGGMLWEPRISNTQIELNSV